MDSQGIGKETCRVLLSKGAKVYLAARSREKAEAAIAELKQSTGKDHIEFLHLDLADLNSIPGAGMDFKKRESKLHQVSLAHYSESEAEVFPEAIPERRSHVSFFGQLNRPRLRTNVWCQCARIPCFRYGIAACLASNCQE